MDRMLARLLVVALFICISGNTAHPQSDDEAEPLKPATASAPVDAVPYETLTLPSEKDKAWEMMRAANGLHGPNVGKWYVLARYKTYDAAGQPKADGTLEYVRQGDDSWYVSYKEGTKTWTRWRTAAGLYAPKNQSDTPGYPESLLMPLLRYAGTWSTPKAAPPFRGDTTYSDAKLTCFTSGDLAPNTVQVRFPERYCTERDKPALRIAEGSYSIFFNQMMSFQHQIVARLINVKDGLDPVLDVELLKLKSPDESNLALLTPPADVEVVRDTTLILPPSMLSARLIKYEKPKYPSGERLFRATVRLSITLGVAGHVKAMEVLHSPGPAYTKSAEDAVRQWLYEPYRKDGQPVEHTSTVRLQYYLGR